jgi:hypothetical protein
MATVGPGELPSGKRPSRHCPSSHAAPPHDRSASRVGKKPQRASPARLLSEVPNQQQVFHLSRGIHLRLTERRDVFLVQPPHWILQ